MSWTHPALLLAVFTAGLVVGLILAKVDSWLSYRQGRNDERASR